jgi:hypothetical protein
VRRLGGIVNLTTGPFGLKLHGDDCPTYSDIAAVIYKAKALTEADRCGGSATATTLIGDSQEWDGTSIGALPRQPFPLSAFQNP